jgi:hypothetical protein
MDDHSDSYAVFTLELCVSEFWMMVFDNHCILYQISRALDRLTVVMCDVILWGMSNRRDFFNVVNIMELSLWRCVFLFIAVVGRLLARSAVSLPR